MAVSLHPTAHQSNHGGDGAGDAEDHANKETNRGCVDEVVKCQTGENAGTDRAGQSRPERGKLG